jgi:hypothetical protein
MNGSSRRSLLAICALSLAGFAATTASAKVLDALPVEQRAIAGGRAIRVLVAQPEIKAGITPSNIAVAMGGGLLPALIDAANNASRSKKAEATIAPIRAATGDFDGDALALQTTKDAIAQIPWLQNADIEFSKDTSLLGKSALLDKASSTQTVFIEYTYGMSADFSAVLVNATIHIADKRLPPEQTKPEWRVQPNHVVYANVIATAAYMPNANPKDPDGNAAAWAADNGRAVRTALKQDFAQVAKLLPRTMALSSEDVKQMRSGTHKFTAKGGLGGRLVEEGPDGTLMWTSYYGYSFAQPLASGS